MNRNRRMMTLLLVIATTGCASIKQYDTLRQPVDRDLHTYIGGTVLKVDREESLPSAFGRADGYGGRQAPWS